MLEGEIPSNEENKMTQSIECFILVLVSAEVTVRVRAHCLRVIFLLQSSCVFRRRHRPDGLYHNGANLLFEF
jgi:hypothetical protein